MENIFPWLLNDTGYSSYVFHTYKCFFKDSLKNSGVYEMHLCHLMN